MFKVFHKIFSVFFSLFIVWFLLAYFVAPNRAESLGLKQLPSDYLYENALFRFYSKNFLESYILVTGLMKEHPGFETVKVTNLYLRNLSYLSLQSELEEGIKLYSSLATVSTYLNIIENYQRQNRNGKALQILSQVGERRLSEQEKNHYLFLSAISHITDNRMVEAFDSLTAVSSTSVFYVKSEILKAGILLQQRNLGEALSLLDTLLENVNKGKDALHKNEVLLLSGRVNFEATNYAKAIYYFSNVEPGEFYPEALIGLYWTNYYLGDFLVAAKVLEEIKSDYPISFLGEDLQLNLVFSYLYGGKLKESEEGFEKLHSFYLDKKELMVALMESDELCERYIHFALKNYNDVGLMAYFTIPEKEKTAFKMVKASPEFLNVASVYNVVKQLLNANAKNLREVKNISAYLQKRSSMFGYSVDLYKGMKQAGGLLQRKIGETELPLHKLGKSRQEKYKATRGIRLQEYEKKVGRSLRPFERQLIEMMLFSGLNTKRGSEMRNSLFVLGAEIINVLEKIYSADGNGRRKTVNQAMENNNIAITKKRDLDEYKSVQSFLPKLERRIRRYLTVYIRKEAFRILNKIYVDQEAIKIVRKGTDFQVPEEYVSVGKIDEYLKDRISFLDNFDSDTLLYFADKIYEQELKDHKVKIKTIEGVEQLLQEEGNEEVMESSDIPTISLKKSIAFLDEILEKRPNDEYMDRFLYFRSFCYQETGKIDEAMQGYLAVLEKYPHTHLKPELLFRLGEYYFSTDQLAMAIESYSGILKFPESHFYDKTLYKLGWAYFLTSNFDEAIRYFSLMADISYSSDVGGVVPRLSENALSTEDLSREGLKYAAVSYTNMGSAQEALDLIGSDEKPYSQYLLIKLAEAYFDQSKYDDFTDVYQAYVSRFKVIPDELEVQNRLVGIQNVLTKDGTELVAAKEAFIADFVPGGPRFTTNKKLDGHLLDSRLKVMISDLARYYHREARAGAGLPYYEKAYGYYKRHIIMYPESKEVKQLNFYLAETLLESGRFLEAAKLYDKMSFWVFSDPGIKEQIMYSAVIAYEKDLLTQGGDMASEAGRRLMISGRKYADSYPDNPKSAPLLFRAGERHFALGEYRLAIISLGKAKDMFTNEIEKLVSVEHIADSYFNLGEFNRAEDAYRQLLEQSLKANNISGVDHAEKYIPVSILNIAERLKNSKRTMAAALKFEQAAFEFKNEKDKENALVLAMKLYISARKWIRFDTAFARFRQLGVISREMLQKTVVSAAKVSEENFDYEVAARYFEIASTLSLSPTKQVDMLLLAAHHLEKAGDFNDAIRIFVNICVSGKVSPEREIEYRYTIGELYERQGNRNESKKSFTDLIDMFGDGARYKGDVFKMYRAKSYLKLLGVQYDQFIAMELTPPFQESFAKKFESMDKLLKGYFNITRLELTKFTTHSLFRIGSIFENFQKSILQSPPPEGLNDDELEEYQFMREERAFLYEEKAQQIYEKNIALGKKKNISNEYVDLSYKKLAEISPALYFRKEEQVESNVSLFNVKQFIIMMDKVDPLKYEKFQKDELFWAD